MEKLELDSLLLRLRDAAIFLLKADALALGGMVTLVSVFKIEPPQALGVASSLVWALKFVVGLMIVTLCYEGFLTTAARGTDPSKNHSLSKIARISYFILIALHCMAMAYTLGFVASFLESLSKRVG